MIKKLDIIYEWPLRAKSIMENIESIFKWFIMISKYLEPNIVVEKLKSFYCLKWFRNPTKFLEPKSFKGLASYQTCPKTSSNSTGKSQNFKNIRMFHGWQKSIRGHHLKPGSIKYIVQKRYRIVQMVDQFWSDYTIVLNFSSFSIDLTVGLTTRAEI